MALKLVTPPASYPISLAEAKEHLRVQDDDDDDLISAMVEAATQSAEVFTGRAFIDQTWDYFLDALPTDGSVIQLPNPPLIEVAGLFYLDSADDELTFNEARYVVDDASAKARIALANGGAWPTAATRMNAIRIRFRAGYLNPVSPEEAMVPGPIKSAIKLTIGHLYANRESVVVGTTAVQLPFAAEWLLRQYRVHTGMA